MYVNPYCANSAKQTKFKRIIFHVNYIYRHVVSYINDTAAFKIGRRDSGYVKRLPHPHIRASTINFPVHHLVYNVLDGSTFSRGNIGHRLETNTDF